MRKSRLGGNPEEKKVKEQNDSEAEKSRFGRSSILTDAHRSPYDTACIAGGFMKEAGSRRISHCPKSKERGTHQYPANSFLLAPLALTTLLCLLPYLINFLMYQKCKPG